MRVAVGAIEIKKNRLGSHITVPNDYCVRQTRAPAVARVELHREVVCQARRVPARTQLFDKTYMPEALSNSFGTSEGGGGRRRG